MICADTNAVIGFLKRSSPRLLKRFDELILEGELALPVPVFYELWHGALKSARTEQNLRGLERLLDSPVTVLDFDRNDAKEAGDIRASLERAGTPIGPYDVLIAAQARRRGAVLVTANGREFQRVPGLRVEDWGAA